MATAAEHFTVILVAQTTEPRSPTLALIEGLAMMHFGSRIHVSTIR
jgi:hypothetical protein